MGSFKELLEDYEAKEEEEGQRFDLKLVRGELAENDTFPPPCRFIKPRYPVAMYNPAMNLREKSTIRSHDRPTGSVWGVIPFYGSTVVGLLALKDKSAFDKTYARQIGFDSSQIDRIISFVKQFGRLQFVLANRPSLFANLQFLEPIFRELKPPMGRQLHASLITGPDTFSKCNTEYETLAGFGFSTYLQGLFGKPVSSLSQIKTLCGHDYAIVKHFFGERAGLELGNLMVSDPARALDMFAALRFLITRPLCDYSKGIQVCDLHDLTAAHQLLKSVKIKTSIPKHSLSWDIGKFILEKLVRYAETYEGCVELIQHFDQHELYKVLYSLNEGVRKRNIDLVKTKRDDLSQILDNIWKDADRLRLKAEGVEIGASAAIGLVGQLASSFPGTGILAMLGFQVLDKIMGIKSNSLTEKIAKFVSPDYLVTIYDFKRMHVRGKQ